MFFNRLISFLGSEWTIEIDFLCFVALKAKRDGTFLKLETLRTDMQRICLLIVVVLVVNGWSQSAQSLQRKGRNFDGKWWLEADADERSGFINGAADCLTWAAHEKGFNATPEQLAGKISRFYKAHPESARLTLVEVWQRVAPQPKTPKTSESQEETWKNAHWYLNGDWWGQIGQAEEEGYLEGYLWCTDNRVTPKTDSYSQSVSFYRKKIDAYIETHPKAGSEAVALILYRFRDKPAAASK